MAKANLTPRRTMSTREVGTIRVALLSLATLQTEAIAEDVVAAHVGADGLLSDIDMVNLVDELIGAGEVTVCRARK